MTARAADTMCVSGDNIDAFCSHGFSPSNENQTPERNIIGQVIMFSNPPANSSLETRAATIKPSEIKHNVPTAITNASVQAEP